MEFYGPVSNLLVQVEPAGSLQLVFPTPLLNGRTEGWIKQIIQATGSCRCHKEADMLAIYANFDFPHHDHENVLL